MPRERSRRALLASLGAVALAGCVAGPDQGGTGGRETSPDGGSGTTRTPTGDGTTPTTTGEGTTTSRGDGTANSPGAEPDPPDRIGSDWPTLGHDPGRSNYAAGAAGPTDPVVELWTASTDASLSAPVVADETLYVGGDDGVVRAFDARTGERRWREWVGGPAGTPRVLDGRVFVLATHYDRRGIAALDAGDGTEIWQAAAQDPSALLVAPHGLYWVAGGRSPAVVALEPADGTERWRTGIQDPWVPHPFAGDGTVYLSSGDHGRVAWRFDPGTGEVLGDEPRKGYDFYAERFSLDGTLYEVDPFFGAVSADPGDGDGWDRGLDAAGDVAVGGGADRVYYVGSSGDRPGLYALSRSDGSVEWSTDAITSVVERPVAAEEAVLAHSGNALVCLDPADGTELWSRSGEAFGSRIALADDLLFTTDGGTVRAFRPP